MGHLGVSGLRVLEYSMMVSSLDYQLNSLELGDPVTPMGTAKEEPLPSTDNKFEPAQV